jgi:hypothetical protein
MTHRGVKKPHVGYDPKVISRGKRGTSPSTGLFKYNLR